jgi:hypothetical protein
MTQMRMIFVARLVANFVDKARDEVWVADMGPP